MERRIDSEPLFDRLIADFQERDPPSLTPRSVELPGLPGKADVVVGMRRSGKTYLTYQKMRELRALEEAMKEEGIERGVVVTLREEGKLETPSGPVRIVPAWRWLLEPEEG